MLKRQHGTSGAGDAGLEVTEPATYFTGAAGLARSVEAASIC